MSDTTNGDAIPMPPAAETGTPVVDDDFAAPEDQAIFSRGYVDKLRDAGARYRTDLNAANAELQAYKGVFGVYPEQERDAWLSLPAAWAQDPAIAVAMMEEIVNNYRAETQQAAPPAPPAGEALGQLTPDEVKQLIAEQFAARDASAREQSAIEGIFAEVRAAGYDPESDDGMAVLYNANHYTNGDIAKAVEMRKARDQKLIDDYIAARSGRPLPSPNGGMMAGAARQPITSIEDARKATEAFLRERQGAR
jgi:hypothetical protein